MNTYMHVRPVQVPDCVWLANALEFDKPHGKVEVGAPRQKRHNFDELARLRHITPAPLESKGLAVGVIPQACVKHFDHCRKGEACIHLELLQIAHVHLVVLAKADGLDHSHLVQLEHDELALVGVCRCPTRCLVVRVVG